MSGTENGCHAKDNHEYINRELLKTEVRKHYQNLMDRTSINYIVNSIPAADVSTVKHGNWLEEVDTDAPALFQRRWVCSACGRWQTYGKTDYCPNCGAHMGVTE